MFAETPYFLSEEFTLVDCTLAPLLWRLSMLNIELPAQAKSIKTYMQRIGIQINQILRSIGRVNIKHIN